MSKPKDNIAGTTKEFVGEILGDGRLAAEGAHQKAEGDYTTTQPPDQGITRAGRGEEQPKDKGRAQTAPKKQPGHMPPQPAQKDGQDDKR